MTDTNKGIALPVIIAVVAVLLAGGAYLALKNRALAPVAEPPAPTQPPAPAVNEVDTSNWLTYRNEQYGFQLKHQAEFVLSPRAIYGEEMLWEQQAKVAEATFNIILQRQTCPVPHLAYGWLKKQAFLGEEIYQSVIDGYLTKVFREGCYECYDVIDPVTNVAVSNPALERDGFAIVTCNPRESVCLKVALRDAKSNLEKTKSIILGIVESLSFTDNFDKVDCIDFN